MGEIADAFKDAALSIAKKRQVLRLDAEFSDLKVQVEIIKSENIKLRAEVNPLRREFEQAKTKLALLNAPPHPNASSPEHTSRGARPRVITSRRKPLTSP